MWQRLGQALAEVAVSGEATWDVRELVWMVRRVAEVLVVAEDQAAVAVTGKMSGRRTGGETTRW